MSASLDEHLAPVLDTVTFPAGRWEIVIAAEVYGADLRTRTALRALTRAEYVSRALLVREVAAQGGIARNPVEETARPPRVTAGPRRPRGRALVPPSPHRLDHS